MRTIAMADKFNGHNWYGHTQELDAETQQDRRQLITEMIRLRDLAALHMLESMREVGKHHGDWEALHHLLLDLPPSEWSKVHSVQDN